MTEKKLSKLKGEDAAPKNVTDDLDFNGVQQNFAPKDVVFEPLPSPQTEFLALPMLMKAQLLVICHPKGGQSRAANSVRFLVQPSSKTQRKIRSK